MECEKSPDGKHHYEASAMQSAVMIINGSHTCYVCHYCGDKHCKTVYWDAPDPLKFPTKEELEA